MPRRRLTEDERDLWQRVARSANRLHASSDPAKPDLRDGPVPDPRAPSAPQGAAPAPAPVPGRMTFPKPQPHSHPKTRVDLAESVGDRLAREPVRMDRNLHRSMTRGKLEPEARIDLHGMTVAQAHTALLGFVMSAHARGLRLVLVITGKGRKAGPDHAAPMPVRQGVLKHEVPQWLRAAPLGPLVLETREAHRSHGGTGAYYVYLRRRR
ncbi:DNA mismatch repair protein MutS [Pararhodobacter marinus]|uniref:DNA mismatch repair protein MutS n=1 Tax=Pararhodobacter marinus TaxID=2184063 RepID=A0A2U2CIW8_9RHOB|nr:Smr/MutS family protein [Pararhodobacter marinus]PWE31769.1 DNA mismatch repair protein MutS [Pararhodobacter marinus]